MRMSTLHFLLLGGEIDGQLKKLAAANFLAGHRVCNQNEAINARCHAHQQEVSRG